MSVHITSFIILCRPQMHEAVRDSVADLPGVEIRYCGDNGKIVALAEGGSEAHIGDAISRMQSIPGVIAANMVYHGIDEEANDHAPRHED